MAVLFLGSMPSNLVCSGDSENVVGYSPAVNEQQCWEKCAKTDGCNHYTWFNKGNHFIFKIYFLF